MKGYDYQTSGPVSYTHLDVYKRQHYYSEKASGIFLREEYQSTMLGGYQEVETDADKAITVYEAIEKKISSGDLKMCIRDRPRPARR